VEINNSTRITPCGNLHCSLKKNQLTDNYYNSKIQTLTYLQCSTEQTILYTTLMSDIIANNHVTQIFPGTRCVTRIRFFLTHGFYPANVSLTASLKQQLLFFESRK